VVVQVAVEDVVRSFGVAAVHDSVKDVVQDAVFRASPMTTLPAPPPFVSV